MKKRTIYIGLFLIFIIGVISLIGTFAIDSTITEGNSSKADYLFNITLGDRTNREIVIPSYDSKIVDIKISNPNKFNMSYLLYLEGVNSSISAINISDTGTSGVLNSKDNNLIKVFIQNNSATDITTSIKDIVGFETETLSLPSNSTAINKGPYYKVIVKSNNNDYGKVKPNIKLSANAGTVKYTIVPNDGYQYKSTTCEGTVVDDILTISNITSNVNCEVVFEPSAITISYDATGGNYGTTTYTEAQEHTYKAPYNGTYKIELWGAQGGGTSSYPGGYGGYVKGNIELNKDETLYFYVGENYNGYKNSINFNGGGRGTVGTSGSKNYNGGGATDVRYFGTYTPTETELAWDATIGLNSRIMVASGGGGFTDWNNTRGGNGGGLTGYSGNKNVGSIVNAAGGTQTDGGLATNNTSTSPRKGDFGIGGYNATYAYEWAYEAGGGGGYYGGGSGGAISGSVGSGAGGSSYISGHTGSVAITSSSDRTPRNDSSNSTCTTGTSDNLCSIHYSNKKFTDTVMIDGSGYSWTNTKGSLQQMPTINGGLHESGIGNSGNGSAKITIISASSYQAYYGGNYETLPTPSKEGYEFAGWYTEPNGKGSLITAGSKISNGKDHTLYAYWTPKAEYTSPGSYTYIVPRTGLYKLETWGAQGGQYDSTKTARAGYGGYSVGYIKLTSGQALYVNVGGQGAGGADTVNGYRAVIAGGYNGGGQGQTWVDSKTVGGGGGASHIATVSGLLSTLSSNLDSILIVSGGGGGAASSSSSYNSGDGGGYLGSSGYAGGNNWIGTGGSQTAGGSNTSGTTTIPGFGQGGYAGVGNSSGGGGGFYGGGAGVGAGGYGGGGSGYIGNSLLSDKKMFCYNCAESFETSTYTINTIGRTKYVDLVSCPNGYSSDPASKCAKAGNGAVRITFVDTDVEPPTGTISASIDYNTISASIDASDDYGIDHYEYYLSTSSTCPTTGYTTSKSNTYSTIVKKVGTYYVCAKVVDGNDNVLSLKSNAIEVSKIYSATIRYNVNGGTITPSTGSYTWTTDSTGLIYRNGSVYEQTIYYGETADLADYNNSNYINIDPGDLHVTTGGEWICLSGCSTSSKVFSQTTKYNATDFCDVTSGSCAVVLGLRLVSDSTPPTCSLSANESTITATASDNIGISYQGWNSSYSGDSSTSKDIAVGDHIFYVKDTVGNTNTCSISIKSTNSEQKEVQTETSAFEKWSATGSCTCKKINPGSGTNTGSGTCTLSGCSCPSGTSVSSSSCSKKHTGYYCTSGSLSGSKCIHTSYETVYTCDSGYTKINDSYCYK